MNLVLAEVFLGEDRESRELFESWRKPAASSDEVLVDDVVVHLSWVFIHLWLNIGMISSLNIFSLRLFPHLRMH